MFPSMSEIGTAIVITVLVAVTIAIVLKAGGGKR